MLAAIGELPRDEQEVFDLVRIQGMTQVEAAQLLDVSTVTVKRRLTRGLQLLEEQLADLRPEKIARLDLDACRCEKVFGRCRRPGKQPPRKGQRCLPNRWSTNCLRRISVFGRTPEEVCVDPELLTEVRRALATHARAARGGLDALFRPRNPAEPSIPQRRGIRAATREIPGYDVGALLGRGGMGVVYKARQLRVNRLVALKMLISGASMPGRPSRPGSSSVVTAACTTRTSSRSMTLATTRVLYFDQTPRRGAAWRKALAGTPLPARRAAAAPDHDRRGRTRGARAGIVRRDGEAGQYPAHRRGHAKVADSGLASTSRRAGGATTGGTGIRTQL